MNNNKDKDDLVFEVNEEEGKYIEHLKKFLFCDDYPRPNRNDFIKSKIGKFRKKAEIKAEKEMLENPNLSESQKKKNIHKGHRKRLRETFNNVNPVTMPDHQILELMLSYVQPQKDVNPLAHELLNEFGSFANVLEANPDDLKKVKGIGEVIASFIHFCSKIPAIYNNSKICYKTKLNNPIEIVDYLRSKVPFGTIEEFYYLCLNNKGNILCFKSLGTGNVSQLYVNTRILTQQILKYQTEGVVICHTHPSGSPNPSFEDKQFTFNLCSLLQHLHIKLLDHVIISPDGYFSFFQNNIGPLGKDNVRNRYMTDVQNYNPEY